MRSRVPVVVAVAVAVTVSGAAIASGGQSRKSGTMRLSVQATFTRLDVVDVGPAGASPGDLVVEADSLSRHGKRFGSTQINCVGHSGDLGNGTAQCTGTFFLPDGALETQGWAKAVNGAIDGAGAVTGGTGTYRAVRGSYTFRTTSGTDRTVKFALSR